MDTGEDSFLIDGDELTEVEVDENAPIIDDDSSTVFSDNVEEVRLDENENVEEDLHDDSKFTFNGHSDSVYSVAINSMRPGLILTGGGDDAAYLWNYNDPSFSNESSMEIEGKTSAVPVRFAHTDTVTSVGFNFDGKLALTGSYDGTVKIWNVDTSELVVVLDGPEDIEWAEWHKKGNAVIAGSTDGTIWMWLTHNGQCVQVFAGHEGSVSCGCFSNDGKFICSGGDDGSVRIWLPKSGQCKHVFKAESGHDAVVTSITTNALGDLLLTGSGDGTMKIYSISSSKLLHTFGHSSSLNDTSPEVIFDTPTIREALKEDDEQSSAEIAGFAVECVGFSSEEFKWVASGGMDSTAKVWDISSGLLRSVCAHTGSVVALKWHLELPTFTTACLDRLVRIWDARNGTLLMRLSGHNDLVTNIATSQIRNNDGEVLDLIITASDDYASKVFAVNIAAALQ